MKRLAWILLLASGCAPWPHVERYIPSAVARSAAVAVAHPAGRTFALDPDSLQREVGEGFRRAGFERVILLSQGASDRGGADLTATVGSELLARPLEDDGLGTSRHSFAGERVGAVLQITDKSGTIVYRATRIERLSSALTEARVARALLRPLEE